MKQSFDRPEVTLCGRQDVEIQLLTDNSWESRDMEHSMCYAWIGHDVAAFFFLFFFALHIRTTRQPL